MAIEGLRVVRGQDWSHGGEDGGEGHVGTVAQDNQDGTVAVQWDMGGETICRIGKSGKLDLLVLDSAPAGVKHKGVACCSCDKADIAGARWKCTVCRACDLCTPCYFYDKHDIQHQFSRIDEPGATGQTVSKRSTSVTVRALGIYKGSSVKRGPDWSYGNQDGGSGKVGIVDELKNYGTDGSERDAVTVRWANNDVNTYKLGYRGKVDLTCVEESPGTYYYRDHLQPLSSVGQKAARSMVDGASGGGAQPHAPPHVIPSKTPLKPGDMACVDLPEAALKAAQRGHGGWSMRMAEYIGQIGRVKQIESNGDVVINFDGKEWKFYSGAVRKVVPVKQGDIVRIESDEDKVMAMQKKHGGWNADMSQALGKVGKVVKVDSDGDVAVQFGSQAWVFNPACCEQAPGCKPDNIDDSSPGGTGGSGGGSSGSSGSSGIGSGTGSGSAGGGGSDDAADLLQKLARLMVFDAMTTQLGPQQLVSAASKGDAEAVRQFLGRSPNLVNRTFKGLTPLIIASHEGHERVVDVLLDKGADVDSTDEKGNTPLMAALMRKHESIAEKLIKRGANVNKVTKIGRNALHVAALNGANNVLRTLLQKSCNLNQQDLAGDTPLHDAVSSKNNYGLAFLLADPRVNATLCNRKGHNILHLAAMKDDEMGASKILSMKPQIVDVQKSDGYTALHIAAVNDHVDVAKVLLKAKADVNAVTTNKMTPLHIACHQGYPKIAELLIDHSAIIGSPDSDGDTPLHVCLLGNRNEGDGDVLLARMLGLRVVNEQENKDRVTLACFLIQKGASVTVRNNRGRTPLEVCNNDRVRNAVRMFAEEHAPQASTRRNPLEELLLEMPLPCAGCRGKLADARLMPCRHKVLCKNCSFRTRECPACHQRISSRTDLQGNELMMVDPCKVQ